MTDSRTAKGNGNGGQRSATPRHRTPRHFEPVALDGVSTEAMKLHIGLYEGYVKAFNELLDAKDELGRRERDAGERDGLTRDGLARRFAFEWNGIRLHELFFDGLGIGGDAAAREQRQRQPAHDSPLLEAMDRGFGGFEAWQEDVRGMGDIRGIGWVLTVWDPLDGMLSNVWVASHDLGVPAGATIVLAFDLWEHAYLTDYAPAERADFLEALLRNIDYGVAEARLRGRRLPEAPQPQRGARPHVDTPAPPL